MRFGTRFGGRTGCCLVWSFSAHGCCRCTVVASEFGRADTESLQAFWFWESSTLLRQKKVHRTWQRCARCGEGCIWSTGAKVMPSGGARSQAGFRGPFVSSLFARSVSHEDGVFLFDFNRTCFVIDVGVSISPFVMCLLVSEHLFCSVSLCACSNHGGGGCGSPACTST